MPVLPKNLLTTGAAAAAGWSANAASLVAETLRGQRHPRTRVRLRVNGESMLPSLWPGDFVEIEGCSLAEVRAGEIVLARRDGRLFLHRFLSSEPGGFWLRGDSMPGPDPLYPSETLLGRLVTLPERLTNKPLGLPESPQGTLPAHSTPLLRWVDVRLARAVGFVLCHCTPIRRVALRLHGDCNALSCGSTKSENARDMRAV
jgi:hypothetical protein